MVSMSLSSILLSWPLYILSYNSYFSSSLWSLFSASNSSSLLLFSVTSSGASVIGGGGISDFITSNGFSFVLLSNLQLTKSYFDIVLSLFYISLGFRSLKSFYELFCSLALALVPSQSLLDQSDSWGEGCGAPCSQYEHDRPKLSHTIFGIGAFISTLSNSDTFESEVLCLLTFIGFNQFLLDHLVLILPLVCFLRFLGILGWAENWTVLLSFHGIVVFCLWHLGMPVFSVLEREMGLLSYSTKERSYTPQYGLSYMYISP